MIRWALCLASLFASGLRAQYVGAKTCEGCHPDKFAIQSKSGHARALAPASAGSPGQWAFGAGAKAITYVSQVDEDTYVEHGLSYYAATRTMALTPGHTTADDHRYPTFDPTGSILRCFRCHSTGALKFESGFRVAPSETGVRCEACHGPGAVHAKSGRAADIFNPKRLNAVELNDACGTCHRKAPEAGDEKDWSNAWNTRHQPVYLSQAACFRKSAGRMSCLTCHDPHAPLARVAADYDKRCSACHASVRHQTPVAARSCVGCHMPKVPATPQLQFTNHWIGIYGRSNALLPIRRTGRSLPPLTLPPTAERKIVPPNDPAGLRGLFEEALTDRERALGPKHPKVARAATNLGLFLRELDEPAAAESPLRKALEIDRANEDRALAGDEESLAQILDALGRRRESFELFRQAASRADAGVAARSFASLAILDPAHADDYYKSALQAEETASGAEHPRVAIALNNLALALMEKNAGKGAEPLFRRALAIQQKALGRDHYESAATLNNLGSLLQELARSAEAERFEREAIRILERQRPQTKELAAAYTNLADLLAAKGDRVNAAALLRQTLAIDESIYGLDDIEVAADLRNLGMFLRENGDRSTAEALLKRALAIYEKTLGPNNPQSVEVREALRTRLP